MPKKEKRLECNGAIAGAVVVSVLVAGGINTSELAPSIEPIEPRQVQMEVYADPDQGLDQDIFDQEQIYYDVPLSHDLQDTVFREAERWDVPAALILAMMDQESDYQTDIVSYTNDYGIMQINKINHPRLQDELGITDFMDPEQSIACGAYMIGELLDKYDGDFHHALTAYNRGESGARLYYQENGTYESSYSMSIMDIYKELDSQEDATCR